jgi:N-acetylglucosaminyl-diphospho-decaprenol L-rhamnosyltransferase
MDSYLHQLTAVILTYKTNLDILKNCLKSINPKVKILIVENSSHFKYLKEIQSNFSNIEVVCSGSNLGYGGGNNFGLNKVKTNYALILNPDTVCEDNFFLNINKYLSGNIDFTLIGTTYRNKTDFKPAGFFNKKDLKNAQFDKESNLYEVDWIAGHTILFNMKKFSNKIFFDENFFLFFEEFDLCMTLKKRNEKVYMCPDLKIDHMGWKSSFNVDENFEIHSHKLRNWHYMWSFFYYNKKNYGYLYSLIKSLSSLLRSVLRIIFYSITFNNKQRIIYTYRFLGLINSIFLKKSKYRINIDD